MTATNGIANGVAHDDPDYLDAEEQQSLPPHSKQAEEAVLGSVLKNGLSIADVLPFLKPHHFYEVRHRHIYAAMAALFERAAAIDYHMIAEELAKVYREVAKRAVRVLNDFAKKRPQLGVVSDENSALPRRTWTFTFASSLIRLRSPRTRWICGSITRSCGSRTG